MHTAVRMATVDHSPSERQSGTPLVTVIGGAGFIGRRLTADLVSRGHLVRVVDIAAPTDPNVEYRAADVRDFDALSVATEGSTVIYNLAAAHRDDVKPTSLYYDVNVVGASNVARVCRKSAIRTLVFSSSVAVYGSNAHDASEDQLPLPNNDYGHSKLQAEEEYRKWHAEQPLYRSLVIVRPTVVFGEGNRGNVYRLLQQIATRRFVMVGRGQNRKSMAYVDNLCAFLVHTLGLPPGAHLFNYADKPDLTVADLVATILKELGRRPSVWAHLPYSIGYAGGIACDLIAITTRRSLPIGRNRIRKFCSTTTFSAKRLRTSGFQPPIALHAALAKTIKTEMRGLSRT